MGPSKGFLLVEQLLQTRRLGVEEVFQQFDPDRLDALHALGIAQGDGRSQRVIGPGQCLTRQTGQQPTQRNT